MDRMLATAVVIACVKKVGRHAEASEDDKLSAVGVGNEDRVDALVDVIANDRTVGVPSKNHRIEANALHGIDADTEVGDVSDIVAESAVPAGPAS